MRELEIARSRIRQSPHGDVERILQQVIVALETNTSIEVADIYALDYDNFSLVMDMMRSWWLQRYVGVARNGVAGGDGYLEKRSAASV